MCMPAHWRPSPTYKFKKIKLKLFLQKKKLCIWKLPSGYMHYNLFREICRWRDPGSIHFTPTLDLCSQWAVLGILFWCPPLSDHKGNGLSLIGFYSQVCIHAPYFHGKWKQLLFSGSRIMVDPGSSDSVFPSTLRWLYHLLAHTTGCRCKAE